MPLTVEEGEEGEGEEEEATRYPRNSYASTGAAAATGEMSLAPPPSHMAKAMTTESNDLYTDDDDDDDCVVDGNEEGGYGTARALSKAAAGTAGELCSG